MATMTKTISAALIGLFALTASAARVQAEPIFVEVETAPPAIEYAPQVVYLGHPAYYSQGHWYYRHGSRWAYYRDEPRPLYEYRARPAHYHRDVRVVHERRAPAAREFRHEERARHHEGRRHER
jgi:hypothetical protein